MWEYDYTLSPDELYHYGVLGMKWGVRRSKNYKSTSIKSARARRQNEKVDKGFDDWKKNAQKKANAIDLGKKANVDKMAYENNKNNKDLKRAYKDSNKAYKKALNDNTSYRKGQVRKEVGSDLSRKYLSEAKKVQKQLKADPSNKKLQKQYNDLMSKHDIERAKARKAPEVGENRSRRKAAAKRAMTMSVKAAATTAAIAGGTMAVNAALRKTGTNVSINSDTIRNVAKIGKKITGYGQYFY